MGDNYNLIGDPIVTQNNFTWLISLSADGNIFATCNEVGVAIYKWNNTM